MRVGCRLAQSLQIPAVRAQRGDAALDGVGDIDGVGGPRPSWPSRCTAPSRAPALRSQIAKHPAVAGIPGCVHPGQADRPMVGVVQAAPDRPRVGAAGHHQLRAAPADDGGDVPPERQAVLHHAVGIVQELDIVDPDLGGPGPFLRLPNGAAFRRVQRVDAGLAGGDQQVADRLAGRGPRRHRAGGAVLQIVGMRRDAQRAGPVVGEGFQVVGHPCSVAAAGGGRLPRPVGGGAGTGRVPGVGLAAQRRSPAMSAAASSSTMAGTTAVGGTRYWPRPSCSASPHAVMVRRW